MVQRSRSGSGRFGRGAIAAGAVCVLAASIGGVSGSTAGPALAAGDGCVVDTSDVIGWWRGEDDLVGQVGPALDGSVTFDDAFVRRGLVFDGASTVTTAALPTVSTGVTFETWVRPVANGLVQTIVSRWDDTVADDAARSFALMIGPTGELLWMTDESSTLRPEQLYLPPTSQLYDGNFHHVAVTWDTNEFAIYVDGALVASKPSQGLPLNEATTVLFRLGTKSGIGDPFFFTGVLDEPTVWRRALTPSEVGTIAAAGAEGKCTFVPVQRAELTPPGANGTGWFGFSVGVDATTVVVGAPNQSAANVFSGAAYVFVRGATGVWSQQARLVASDAGLVDQFGWSVAADGDTIVVGSYGNNGGGADSGAVYVFTRTGTTWTQQQKLLSTDIAAGDGFGYSVAVDGDSLVVGTPLDDDAGSNSGSAYVFTRSGTVWTQQAKLTAPDAVVSDNFGSSVAIGADSVVVGSPGSTTAGVNSGAAYVYARSAGIWSEQAKLVASDGSVADVFGSSVDIDVDTVIVGSPGHDVTDGDSGAAYLFTGSAGAWAETTKLVPDDGAGGDRFGVSVGIDGRSIVVGAYLDSGTLLQSGSAYVFDGAGVTWTQLTKLEPADAAAGDRFGVAVAISGSLVIGAYLDDTAGGNSGSAYVFAP